MNEPLVSNKLYDALKAVSTVVLPGVSTLYFTLAQLWGWPNAEQVVGTIAALNVFMGAIVQISSRSYKNSDARYAGTINIVNKDGGGKTYDLVLNGEPEDIDMMDEAVFKVSK